VTVSRLFFRITAIIGSKDESDLKVSVVIRDDELLNLPACAMDVRIMERIQDEQGLVLSRPRVEGEEAASSFIESLSGHTPALCWPVMSITLIEPLLRAELSPEQQEADENYRLFLQYQANKLNTPFDQPV
jgi:hypothetical protein